MGSAGPTRWFGSGWLHHCTRCRNYGDCASAGTKPATQPLRCRLGKLRRHSRCAAVGICSCRLGRMSGSSAGLARRCVRSPARRSRRAGSGSYRGWRRCPSYPSFSTWSSPAPSTRTHGAFRGPRLHGALPLGGPVRGGAGLCGQGPDLGRWPNRARVPTPEHRTTARRSDLLRGSVDRSSDGTGASWSDGAQAAGDPRAAGRAPAAGPLLGPGRVA